MVGALGISDLAIVLLVNGTERLFMTSRLTSARRDPVRRNNSRLLIVVIGRTRLSPAHMQIWEAFIF